MKLHQAIDSLADYPHDERDSYASAYLLPIVTKLVRQRAGARIFELGCGNGTVAAHFQGMGYKVTAVDTSQSGIAIARSKCDARFEVADAYDDLAIRFGRFPLVLSLEVVEHCFYPRKFAKAVFDLLTPNGTAIISTPFHGYWKNLALAVSGKLDSHFTALWDGGHIKFWSEPTLHALLREAGFQTVDFHHAGRIPAFAKSMIAVARAPPQ
jgi:2-polyprenyl-3-methyl-5-hydroxy-6-metoxy-1,4-benzoquinol methylase